jgi:DNA-directed RNA polymerase sigma subunit (sigma70/sigma32)
MTIDELIAAHWDGCDVGLEETPEDYTIRCELRRQIARVLLTLSWRKERVIRKRFGLGCPPHTQEEVGLDEEVSLCRVSQIEHAALRTLRTTSRRHYLTDFAD